MQPIYPKEQPQSWIVTDEIFKSIWRAIKNSPLSIIAAVLNMTLLQNSNRFLQCHFHFRFILQYPKNTANIKNVRSL
jgi:hypothetical protein